jgi:hypothetical protein
MLLQRPDEDALLPPLPSSYFPVTLIIILK